jgi:Gram-negative porin
MNRRATVLAGVAGALCVSALVVAPAIGAASDKPFIKRVVTLAPRIGIGTFTPAAADPRLAAALSRGGMASSGFRFTPVASSGKNRDVTVAVRARATRGLSESDAAAPTQTATIGIAPVAYNLGAGVGWKRFALSGDVKRVDTGILPGGREGVDLGVSYNAQKWSTRVQVAADRPVGNLPRAITGGDSVSLDVGGSYRLTRNLDVTAGVRYKSERDRLETPRDDRRDSQAIYVGTAFRF